MDIIVLAHSRWEGKYSSTILSLAKVFARENRVFYIGKPYTIKDILLGLRNKEIRRRLPALLFGFNFSYSPVKDNGNFIAVTPPVTISINWLPSGKLFSGLMKVNDRIVYQSIRKAIRKFNIRDFAFINSFQPLYSNFFPKSFTPSKFIYHCVDEIESSPYVSKHGKKFEKIIVKKADEVVTTSKELYRLKSIQSDHVSIVPNGADFGLFQRAVNELLIPPPELRAISKDTKVIIYIGNICHRIDYPLLEAISSSLPDILLLMIGPISHPGYKSHNLDRRENILFIGPKKLEELPAYLRYAHCGIIPFLRNQITRCIYPLKINEYLSAGLPVVTTSFSEDIDDFSRIVHIANNPEDFVDAIQTATESNDSTSKSNRIAFAAGNSWEGRAESFLEILRSENQWKPKQNNLHKTEKRQQIQESLK